MKTILFALLFNWFGAALQIPIPEGKPPPQPKAQDLININLHLKTLILEKELMDNKLATLEIIEQQKFLISKMKLSAGDKKEIYEKFSALKEDKVEETY